MSNIYSVSQVNQYVKNINLSNNEDSMRTISYAEKVIKQVDFKAILAEMKKTLSGVGKKNE